MLCSGQDFLSFLKLLIKLEFVTKITKTNDKVGAYNAADSFSHFDSLRNIYQIPFPQNNMFIRQSLNSRALTLMSKHTTGTSTHMEEEWPEWNVEP